MGALKISDTVVIPEKEIEIIAIRSSGAGGQNVNKVSTAIHLRFNILHSSLPDFYKIRLLTLKSRQLNKDGEIVLKVQKHRTQELNREEAFSTLIRVIKNATIVRKKRKPTRPSVTAKKKRVSEKINRGKVKVLRGKVKEE